MGTASVHFIAPTFDIARRAVFVARELGVEERLECHVSNLQKGLQLAMALEEQGAEVFIARRGTADMIRRNLATPLVHVPIKLEDMAQALVKARSLTGLDRPKIAFFAMPDLDAEIGLFAELLNFELDIRHVVEQEALLESSVLTAASGGAHVIVGGGVVTRMAQKHGIPAIMLDSGRLALNEALSEAMRISYARALEKSQNDRFRAVVDNSNDGVLVFDEIRCLRMTNPAALHTLGRRGIPLGTPVDEILPGLDIESCYAGKTSRNTLVESPQGTLLLNMVPTYVGGEVREAVLSFIPASSIIELSADIHKAKNSFGFISRYSFDDIAGVSPQMLAAKKTARLYASKKAPVLLAGETGTGKELFAHAIHGASPYCNGPFVIVNCASLPASLLESELFGYEKGAFTGAAKSGKPGLFELAHMGSIFLDEISELDMHAQIRLLRVLQDHTTMRVGGDHLIPLDIRVIAATNRNLWEMVGQGSFRSDLFFRLNVLPLFIPPLREREGDIIFLAGQVLSEKILPGRGGVSMLKGAALDALLAYGWPGNVRELFNVMERYAVSATGVGGKAPDIGAFLAPHAEWKTMSAYLPAEMEGNSARGEKTRISAALKENDWHRGQTAKQLGVDRSTLYRKMRIYGLSRPNSG